MERTRLHSLQSILVISICAIICGADDWVAVARYARLKKEWFEQFLDLPNGIPSHDTFSRVFAALDTQAFHRCFTDWTTNIARLAEGGVVAIDGKTARRSFDRATSKSPLHMVSAWADSTGLVLGQLATDAKSNEITAIPALLDTLDIKGSTVTVDAMGCQKKITAKIVDKQADYVIGLKDNQPTLADAVRAHFEEAIDDDFSDPKFVHVKEEVTPQNHGRIESREIFCTSDLSFLGDMVSDWKDLKTVALICSTRTINGVKTMENRFYISSLFADRAEKLACAVRKHWGIENKLHWILDVAFNEDVSRVRKGNGAENFATLRHMAANLLSREKTAKVGVKNKRLSAGWDNGYLLKVLGI